MSEEQASSPPGEPEVARFYTRSRKFPRMVGRLPEGTRIWGGPYTFTQLGLGVAAMLGALLTRSVWSTGSILVDLALILGIGWGVAYLGRYIPMTSLNPIVVLGTALGAFSAPRAGTYRGRPIALPKPHGAGGRVVVDEPGAPPCDALAPRRPVRRRDPRARPVPSSRPIPAPVSAPPIPAPAAAPPMPAPDRAAPRPVTGLERLLAQTDAGR